MTTENTKLAVDGLLAKARQIDGHAASVVFWRLSRPERRAWNVAIELLGSELLVLQELSEDARELKRKEIQNEVGAIIRQFDAADRVLHHVRALDDASCYCDLRPDLEDKLRRNCGLRDAVVVDTSPLGFPAGCPADNLDAWNDYDDQVHELLGA